MQLKRVSLYMLVVACILSLSPAAVWGQPSQTYYQKLEGHVGSYNTSSEKIPGIVKRLFGNEKINFYIGLADGGEETIGVEISAGGKSIDKFAAEELEKPTMRVYVSGAAIDGVLQNPSMDSALEVIAAMKIEGVGLMKKGKVFLINTVSRVLGWFR